MHYNVLIKLLGRRLCVHTLAITAIAGVTTQAWALPGTSNLAPAGTATGTATDFGASVEDGIDGNRDGNFGNGSVYYSVSGGGPANPLFYEVDLGINAYVERVQILRRSDAAQGVFANITLTIYEDDGTGNPGAIVFQEYYLPGFQVGTFATTDPGAQAAFGRHVRVDVDSPYWLTFAEFEVIGSMNPLKFTENNNIAAGKPVTTSSPPGYGALIGSANDGDINADFNAQNRPVYHSTNSGVGEYWQVDLGQEFKLDYLELFARSDDHTTSEYSVSVLNEGLVVVGSAVVNNPAFNTPTPGFDHTIDVSGLVGRYLRVETTQAQFLAFTELRAFAVPEPAGLLLLTIAALGWTGRRDTPRG
jgi:hypothetical protein